MPQLEKESKELYLNDRFSNLPGKDLSLHADSILSLSFSCFLTFLVGAPEFFLLPISAPSPIPSHSGPPPRKPVLHAESVTCLHAHFIFLRGYLELLPPPSYPLFQNAERGSKQQPVRAVEDLNVCSQLDCDPRCSWRWSVVEVRTLLIRTQEITNHTAPHRAAS